MQNSTCLKKLFPGFMMMFALAFLQYTNLHAQVESDERPLMVSQDGIGFKKDSVFLLNLRFRMQNRFGYFETLDGEEKSGVEAVVRRLRLRFDGFMLSPKLGYYIQLSFSRSDQDLVSGAVSQIIRDAMVYYTVNKHIYFGFGQSKLPGNRERVISSGNLQLPDRSIANQTFTLDRDFGFFAYSTFNLGTQQILQLKATITSGEGRGQLISTSGLAYTGRVEWLPLGNFKNRGDYSEGDIEFEPKPKLSIGATYSYNNGTTRSGGQIGTYLPNGVNLQTFIGDMMFKYSGWGIMGEYFHRTVKGFEYNGSNDLAMNRIPRGDGFNFHLSRMLGRKSEVAARYAGVNPQKGYEPYQFRFRTKALGYTYYLNKHRIKFQYYLGFDDRYSPGNFPGILHNLDNRLHTMIQVELGI